MFGPIGATELIIILVLALIIFGPGKLPEVGKAVGRSIREFKKAQSSIEEDVNGSVRRDAGSGSAEQSAKDATKES